MKKRLLAMGMMGALLLGLAACDDEESTSNEPGTGDADAAALDSGAVEDSGSASDAGSDEDSGSDDDGGTAQDGGSDGGDVDQDASPNEDAGSDGSAGSLGGVKCGDTTCGVGQACCYGSPPTCVEGNAVCEPLGVSRIACDGVEDCQEGEQCMDVPGIVPLSVGCRDADGPYGGYCHTDDDCGAPGDLKCCPAPYFPELGKCMAAFLC